MTNTVWLSGLNNRNECSLQFWRLGSSGSNCRPVWFRVRALFLFCRHHLALSSHVRDRSLLHPYKVSNPVGLGVYSYNLIQSQLPPESSISKYSHVGWLRLHTWKGVCGGGGGRGIQSITAIKTKEQMASVF